MDASLEQPPAADRHVVDQLIEERAVRLRKIPPLWAALKAIGYPILGYRRAVAMADTVAPMSGRDAMDWTSDFLKLRSQVAGVENVPESGGVVLICNHPGGIADGVAVWDALAARRPDLCFFANRDAVRVIPAILDVIVPVEWRVRARTRATARETLRAAAAAFKAQRCVAIFPAGAMSEWSWRRFGLEERPWQHTAISMARKHNLPIVPVGVRARLTWLFYALSQVSEEMRNMTVFYELLKKKNARYGLTFGAPIRPGDLPSGDAAASDMLREQTQALAWPHRAITE